MPTYEIEHAGSKYEVDTDKDLSPSEMKDLFQASVNAGAIESSPGVARQGTSGKASVSLDPIERPVDKLIPRLASEVQEAKIAGTPGFLESVQSVFEDRNQERAAEAKRPKGFLDSVITGLSSVGSSARDNIGQLALSPLTLPKAAYDLGKTSNKRWGGKGLAGGDLNTGEQLLLDAMDLGSDSLPMGREIKGAIAGRESFPAAVSRRLQEDPTGLAIDFAPFVGIAKSGLKAASSGLSKYRNQGGIAFSPSERLLNPPPQAFDFDGYIRSQRRLVGTIHENAPITSRSYHNFPEPGAAADTKLFGGRPAKNAVDETPPRGGSAAQDSEAAEMPTLLHENLEALAERYELNIGDKADWYESWKELRQAVNSDPMLMEVSRARFGDGSMDPKQLSRRERMAGAIYLQELEQQYNVLMSNPEFTKAHTLAVQVVYKKIENTAKILYQAGSEAGRNLALQKVVLVDPNSVASVISRADKLVGGTLSEGTKRALSYKVARHKKVSEQLREQLLKQDADSQPYVSYMIQKTKPLLDEIARLEAQLNKVQAKIKEIENKVVEKQNLGGNLQSNIFGVDPQLYMAIDDLATGGDAEAIKSLSATSKKLSKEKTRLADQLRKKFDEAQKEVEAKVEAGVEPPKTSPDLQAARESFTKSRESYKKTSAQTKRYNTLAKKYEDKLAAADFEKKVGTKRFEATRKAYDTAKRNAELSAKADEKLENLGNPREQYAKNTRARLGDAGMLEYHDAAQNLDNFSRKIREKYGKDLPDQFINDLFIDAGEQAKKLSKGDADTFTGAARKELDSLKAEMMHKVQEELGKKQHWLTIPLAIVDLGRAMMTAADVSYIGRQGAILGSGRFLPSFYKDASGATKFRVGAYGESAWKGIKTTALSIGPGGTQRRLAYAEAEEAAIIAKSLDNWGTENFYKDMGLEFSPLSPDISGTYTGKLSGREGFQFGQEEMFRSTLASKIPGVKQLVGTAEASFAVGLNYLRAEAFDSMAKANVLSGGRTLTKTEDLQAIANYINQASGRGYFPNIFRQGEGNVDQRVIAALPMASVFLFSPRFTASRAGYLGLSLPGMAGIGYGAKTAGGRLAIAREHAKFAGALAAFYAGSHAMGLEIGTDPTQSTYGTVKLPSGAYLDPLAGLKQLIVAAMRIKSGTTTNISGKTRETQWYETPSNLLRTKASPLLGSAINAFPPNDPARWKDFIGQPWVPKRDDDKYKAFLANAGVGNQIPPEARRYYIGTVNIVGSQLGPLTLSGAWEEYRNRVVDGSLSAEDAASIFAHTLINAAGFGLLNIHDQDKESKIGVRPKKSRSSYNPYGGLRPLRELRGLRPLKEL